MTMAAGKAEHPKATSPATGFEDRGQVSLVHVLC